MKLVETSASLDIICRLQGKARGYDDERNGPSL